MKYVKILFYGAFLAASVHFFAVESSTALSLTMATTLEAKATLSHQMRFPMLVGSGSLTENNNLKLGFGAEVSPVSLNATCDAVLTPIAFLEFSFGASAGSGWNIPIANGLRMNVPVGERDNEFTGGPFSGMVWSVKGGAAFQFDLAALKSGDWNHIIFRTYHGGKYRALSSAGSSDSWLYEADSGENRNGWEYNGSYLLGYMMPVRFNFAGILIENNTNLYNADGGSFWGDNLPRWTLGLLGNVEITDKTSLLLIGQAHTRRNFRGDTGSYGFYQKRELDTDRPMRVEFYRLAATLKIQLR